MKVVIVGCGQVGATLAYQLNKMGHLVVVIDQDEKAFDHLPEDFQGRVVKGDVLTKTVLHRAEVSESDALFALTDSDPLNALVAQIAHSEYSVPTVAARNNDPRQLSLQEAFGITVIGTPGWSADSLVDLLSGEAVQAIRLNHRADLVIYKIVVPKKWEGRNLDELVPMDHVKILKWTRDESDLPSEETHFVVEGDQIYMRADADVVESMRDKLDSGQE